MHKNLHQFAVIFQEGTSTLVCVSVAVKGLVVEIAMILRWNQLINAAMMNEVD